MDTLAQWVAKKGGLRLDDPVLGGEVAEIRELNSKLRGRHALVRSHGVAVDLLALWATEEGYPVIDQQEFLDLLMIDGWAWVTGDDKRRVRAYQDDEERDSATDFWKGYDQWLQNQTTTHPVHTVISQSEPSTSAGASITSIPPASNSPKPACSAPPTLTDNDFFVEPKHNPTYSASADTDFFVDVGWADLDFAA